MQMMKQEVFMCKWLINKEAVTVSPEIDDDLIMDYVSFCVTNNPYKDIEESFPCTWFFTNDNKLTSYTGKFAEPTIWFNLLVEKFFKPRGYKVGTPEIIQDLDKKEFYEINSQRIEQFIDWKYRILNIAEKKLLQYE